jgi:uncharacterized protein (TIGR03578 family)
MAEVQCMETSKRDIVIQASGNSKTEAFNNIFTILRRQIYKEVDGLIIHMEPMDVFILDESVKKYTERFLWLFMPREKAEYTIKVKIIVLIKYIKL